MLIPDNLMDAARELADAAERFLEEDWDFPPKLEDYGGDETSFTEALQDYADLQEEACETLARSLRDFRSAELRELYARTLTQLLAYIKSHAQKQTQESGGGRTRAPRREGGGQGASPADFPRTTIRTGTNRHQRTVGAVSATKGRASGPRRGGLRQPRTPRRDRLSQDTHAIDPARTPERTSARRRQRAVETLS
jgi:hypothetical protein